MGWQNSLKSLVQSCNRFFSFLGAKLKNFPTLSRGEQVSYISLGAGLLFMLVALILFMV